MSTSDKEGEFEVEVIWAEHPFIVLERAGASAKCIYITIRRLGGWGVQLISAVKRYTCILKSD